MIFKSINSTAVSTLVVGILRATGYPVDQRIVTNRISLPMFVNALNKLVRGKRPLYRPQSLDIVNRYIDQLHDALLEEPTLARSQVRIGSGGNVVGNVWVVHESGPCIVFVIEAIEGIDRRERVRVDVGCSTPEIELLVMVQWLASDYLLRHEPMLHEGHELSLGMWLASKLYEVERDEAGKLATIDAGKELRGVQ